MRELEGARNFVKKMKRVRVLIEPQRGENIKKKRAKKMERIRILIVPQRGENVKKMSKPPNS